MTHISSNLSTLSALQFTAQTPPTLSTAASKADDNVVNRSIAFQRISSLGSRQFAIRAASDAISFIQETDNALFSASSILLELRLLAEQASKGSLSSTENKNLLSRVDKLKSSLDLLAKNTRVNEKNILDGSVDTVSFQVGNSSSELIKISGFNVNPSALGSLPGFRQSTSDRVQITNSVSATQGIQEGNATVSDINNFSILVSGERVYEHIDIAQTVFGGAIKSITDSATLTQPEHSRYGSGLAKSIAERIASIRLGGEKILSKVRATALTQFKGSDVLLGDFSGAVDSAKNTSVGNGTLKSLDLLINGVDVGALIVTKKDSSGGLARAINDKSDITGVFASVNAGGELNLSAYDGRDIVVSTSSAQVSNVVFGAGDSRFSEKFTNLRITGRVTLSSDHLLNFLGADIFQTGFDNLKLEGTVDNALSTGTIFSAEFGSASAATSALSIIDSALSQVASFRAELEESKKDIISQIIDPFAVIEDASSLAGLTQELVGQQPVSALLIQANNSVQQTLALLK
ncbi:MAG: hypothetical protein JKY66_11140 [Spongiibacteraceae bacterium]|nr:hypothetical protein [Spongiibacteraceae bacterium]